MYVPNWSPKNVRPQLVLSYDEGGYEARSSNFKAGTAEQIIKEGKELIESL